MCCNSSNLERVQSRPCGRLTSHTLRTIRIVNPGLVLRVRSQLYHSSRGLPSCAVGEQQRAIQISDAEARETVQPLRAVTLILLVLVPVMTFAPVSVSGERLNHCGGNCHKIVCQPTVVNIALLGNWTLYNCVYGPRR